MTTNYSILHKELMNIAVPDSLMSWIRKTVFDDEKFDLMRRRIAITDGEEDIQPFTDGVLMVYSRKKYDAYNTTYDDCINFAAEHGYDYPAILIQIREILHKHNLTTADFVEGGLYQIESYWYYNHDTIKSIDFELYPFWQWLYYKCEYTFCDPNEFTDVDKTIFQEYTEYLNDVREMVIKKLESKCDEWKKGFVNSVNTLYFDIEFKQKYKSIPKRNEITKEEFVEKIYNDIKENPNLRELMQFNL